MYVEGVCSVAHVLSVSVSRSADPGTISQAVSEWRRSYVSWTFSNVLTSQTLSGLAYCFASSKAGKMELIKWLVAQMNDPQSLIHKRMIHDPWHLFDFLRGGFGNKPTVSSMTFWSHRLWAKFYSFCEILWKSLMFALIRSSVQLWVCGFVFFPSIEMLMPLPRLFFVISLTAT